MLVYCRVPRHHGIDALTGLMQTHIFYLIKAWGNEGSLSAKKQQQENKSAENN